MFVFKRNNGNFHHKMTPAFYIVVLSKMRQGNAIIIFC